MKEPSSRGPLPVKLGITGGAGCGKSVVCDILERRGWTVLRSDDMARKAVEPGSPAYDKIVKYFGRGILLADKTIDRRRLRGIITRDPEKKEMLEGFVHPAVFALMEEGFEQAKRLKDQVVVVEVPLLFEAGMEHYFDSVLIVTVDREKRIKRLMKRDGITEQEAEALAGIQMPEAEKIKKSDFVIDNNGSLVQTSRAVDRFHDHFINQIQAKQEIS